MINRSRARLVGMTNVCESLINIVNRIKRNVIVTLKPKRYVAGYSFYIWEYADVRLPVDLWSLTQQCHQSGTR